MPKFSQYILILSITVISASLKAGDIPVERSMEVTATAYTMREAETKKGHIGLAAWGDQLVPGMKVIAVSRDLIPQGLTHETKVSIDGLAGTYVLRDKMNRRWSKKIDIFMGKDLKGALEWGKRKVVIRWIEEPNDLID